MITPSIKFYYIHSTNPYVNLAFEDYLFRKHQSESSLEQILIIWKSAPSIVMGKFQNPWLECQVKKIRELGINLVRRQSGGGCVYHDLGNINYSFISPKTSYDKSKNASIVVSGLRSLGINAFENERHDLRLHHENVDYKISGCAFKETKHSALHHGTLLIDANLNQLNELLRSKLTAESAMGVKSVPSKVINLKEVNAAITESSIVDSIKQSFEVSYDSKSDSFELFEQDICSIESLMEKIQTNMSWEWVYGATPKFSFMCDDFLVTAKYAKIISCEPENPSLIDLIVDKDYYLNRLELNLTEQQSEFVEQCHRILFV
ncbi:lipoyltransferase and lipoate-protein ligase [Bacteriovorax sp. BAL6_X]|uniref:lipoate--protein ligase family protein n=1 Tax=Bacteriovorax sp. BAL6_X TaxID=1201290 RepID=UPI000386BB5A|nr:lipoate--protein ligase [Bacteriovorax sp. BAL6_X]EPZ50859.1 lipoyltransferase and lipoate-protein ligase [Bacteriovorax sp. BAL6_X]